MNRITLRSIQTYSLSALVLSALLIAAGCGTPPSVQPLLAVSQRVLLEEAQRVDDDTRRDAQRVDQSLRALEAAFAADLHERDALDPPWVLSAVRGYAAAREALVEHRLALAHERQTRAQNLRQAAALTDRAVGLLQRRDTLVQRVLPRVEPEAWRWLIPGPAADAARR